MKKLLLASAVAALSVSAAQAAPTVYGKAFVVGDYVNTSLDDYNPNKDAGQGNAGDPAQNPDGNNTTPDANNDNTADDVTDNADNGTVVGVDGDSVQINSYSSRIGFKGSEPLTDNTDVIYQLEYGISVDGSGDAFKNRDTYLGVANKQYGTFKFGKNTSTLDYVNNVALTEGYWDNLGTNTLPQDAQVAKALNMASDERINNSVVWEAPKFGNIPLNFAVMYGADESFTDSNKVQDNGYGAAAMYDQGTGLTAGVAYDKDLDIQGDIVRGTLTYDLSNVISMPIKMGALYQQADYDNKDTDEKGFVLSAEMPLNNFNRPASIYAQYNNTTDLDGVDSFDSNQIVVGGKYKFNKAATGHLYAGANSADLDGRDADVFAMGAGLEYKF